MKKLMILAVALATSLAAFGQSFQARQFLNPTIRSVMITNAAGIATSQGGWTNLYSPLNTTSNKLTANPNYPWRVYGTNPLSITWTNSSGIWVIPTNNTPQTQAGVASMVTNDYTDLFLDVPLWTERNGAVLSAVVSNDTRTYLSPVSISATVVGQASAATTLNFIFSGLPDGTNEVNGANGTPMTFQWGFVPAAGVVTSSTNFPAHIFAGCRAIRLRSVTMTTAAAANIGASVMSLSLNGFVP